jgi:hypothetical protein
MLATILPTLEKLMNYILLLYIGLVDADNEEDLITKLMTLKDIWNSREQEFLASGGAPTFYNYITERVGTTLGSLALMIIGLLKETKLTYESRL